MEPRFVRNEKVRKTDGVETAKAGKENGDSGS
jgi:hypothetical protein